MAAEAQGWTRVSICCLSHSAEKKSSFISGACTYLWLCNSAFAIIGVNHPFESDVEFSMYALICQYSHIKYQLSAAIV